MIKTYKVVEALDEFNEPFDPPIGFKFRGQIEKTIIMTTLPGIKTTPSIIDHISKSFPDDYTVLILNGAFGIQFLKLEEIEEDAYPENQS